MPVVVKKPSLKTDFFNPADVGNAIKVYSCGFTSIADVCNLLAKMEIPSSRVAALQKGKDNRDGVLLILTNKDDVDKVRSCSSYVVGNKTLNIVALNKQLVHYRVHLLPAYLSLDSVKSIFEDYGHIIEVKHDFSHYGQNNNKIKNGIFSVTAEVTEIQRREFPHLVEFDCGNACLIPGGGRSPLCLLCKKIGHIKKMCPSFFRTNTTDLPVESRNDQEEPEKDESNEDKTEGEKENETANDDGTDDEMNDVGVKNDTNDEQQQEQQSVIRGKKRSQDSTDGELQDSFHKNFPPLKTRRPSKTPPGISVSNPFSVLDDEDSDSPLVIDESPVESEKSGGFWDGHLGQGS